MFVKWIVCRVPESTRHAFSRAQTAWATIATVPGFDGQVGGWEETAMARTGHEEAAILALWADEASYRRFMGAEHDVVTDANRQEVTYDAVAVDELHVVHGYPGAVGSLSEAVGGSTPVALLRVAECTVRPGHEDHFQEVQKSIWIPGMNRTGAVLATAMARSAVRPERFVVASLWSDEGAHRDYVEADLPGLRQRSGVADDLENLEGYVVGLEGTWTVSPPTTRPTTIASP